MKKENTAESKEITIDIKEGLSDEKLENVNGGVYVAHISTSKSETAADTTKTKRRYV